ncbi:hypothetical protein RB195_000651 [Necator americanus]|uniref:Uncharacterized protein n=1 Tax=Necator americanus TaxID=51031 RepID=A0ABR1DCG4_NECAM
MLKQPSKVLRTATHVFLLLLLDVINVHDLRCWAVEGVTTRLGAAPHTTDKGHPRAERNVTEQSRLARARARAVIEVSTKTRRSAYATGSVGTNVDKIEDVELGPTHIVITTTKQGPVDSLKIHIELIDLHDNRTLPPIQLYGLFLVIARGRYTVPFLKPERWYGLTFTSENQVNGETNVHKETRLLRTTNRQHNITTAEDLYEVIMHRNVDGEESAERLYVTSEWRGEERYSYYRNSSRIVVERIPQFAKK